MHTPSTILRMVPLPREGGLGNRSGSLVRELAAEGRLREYPEKGIKKELPRAENPPEGTAPFASRAEQNDSCYRTSQFSKYFYAKAPETLDRPFKKEYNTILHQYAQ